MGTHREIEVIRLFTNETIAAGTTVTSHIIDLGDYAQGGDLSFQYHITGSGTVYVYYKVGNIDEQLVYSTGGYEILAAGTSVSGTSLDGWDLLVFTPDFCRFMQIVAFESGGASGVTLTSYLAVQ